MNSVQGIEADRPILNSSQDELDRASFANALAEDILGASNHECLVLGIYGEWGSGKTSIINMALENCERAETNTPLVFHFRPWDYSSQDRLLESFFAEFRKILKRPDFEREFGNAADLLEIYARVLLPVAFIPGAAQPAGIIAGTLIVFSKAYRRVSQWFSKSLEEHRKSLERAFEKSNKRLLVVIDDVDRLTSAEIRQVFQLLKAQADFPNITYLIAFDRDVVVNALDKFTDSKGNQFLEKVIQVTYPVPLPRTSKLHKVLDSRVNALIAAVPDEEWDDDYWRRVSLFGFRNQFRNAREIKRFYNIARFNFARLVREVNAVDLLGVSLMQSLYPKIYEFIRNNRDLFVEDHFNARWIHEKDPEAVRRKAVKAQLEEVISPEDDVRKNAVKGLVGELFPEVGNALYGFTSGAVNATSARRQKRICYKDNFDRLFVLDLDEREISVQELEEVKASMANKETFSEMLREINDKGKSRNLFEALLDNSDGQEFTRFPQNIVYALLDLGDLFGPDYEELIGRQGMILALIEKTLGRQTPSGRFDLIKSGMANAYNSFAISVALARTLELDMEKERGFQETNTYIDEYRRLALGKIQKAAEDGRLWLHWDMIRVVAIWSVWDSENTIAEYIRLRTKDDNDLIDYIELYFKGRWDRKKVGEYLDLRSCVDRMNAWLSSEDSRKANNRRKMAVEGFVNIVRETLEKRKEDPNIS